VKKIIPQMLLLDLNLKDGNSLGIIGTLRDQFPDVPILVISQFETSIARKTPCTPGRRLRHERRGRTGNTHGHPHGFCGRKLTPAIN